MERKITHHRVAGSKPRLSPANQWNWNDSLPSPCVSWESASANLSHRASHPQGDKSCIPRDLWSLVDVLTIPKHYLSPKWDTVDVGGLRILPMKNGQPFCSQCGSGWNYLCLNQKSTHKYKPRMSMYFLIYLSCSLFKMHISKVFVILRHIYKSYLNIS